MLVLRGGDLHRGRMLPTSSLKKEMRHKLTLVLVEIGGLIHSSRKN